MNIYNETYFFILLSYFSSPFNFTIKNIKIECNLVFFYNKDVAQMNVQVITKFCLQSIRKWPEK